MNFLDIRTCPFFLIFKIPCPGCGLTRSIIQIFKLDFIGSLQYNILGIPLFIMLGTYFIIKFYCYITKNDYLIIKIKEIIKHKEKTVIIITVVFMIISWINNLYNPLVY